jgi:ABC-2 type transport system permease protein
LSQLGAPLSAASSEFLTLWALAVFYNLVALGLAMRDAAPIGSAAQALPAT